jgi:hypothetical protein
MQCEFSTGFPRRPTFFMKRSDRLIARLRHLMYGLRLSKQVGGQMIMAWTPQPKWSQQFDGPDYHINQIFDLRAFYANGGYHDLIFFDAVTPFPNDLLSLQGPEFDAVRPNKFDRSYFVEQTPTVYSGNYYGYQFADEGKTQAQLDAEVREIYAGIPHDPVAARILATAKQRMNTATYAALHVRRGDVGEMIKRDLTKLAAGEVDPRHLSMTIGHYIGRTAPYEFYYGSIETCISAGSRILFTSDTPETLDHFTKKYGPKHFIDINRFVRSRYPIQKAFLDFNMLIGATKIISTGSTYAAFAATLGGAQLVNVAVGGSLARLEEFVIDEYVPELRNNVSVRRVLRDEIALQCRAKGRVLSDTPSTVVAA